ncbi:hypothetical protein HU200_043841 [Digitaria exilis]|uniref:Uncharacterized protein n=1 Tax=Digitaria exilis TaxID=1010633 RepID=A0A835B3H2_9POAL|nr:hypothetical protein HU200_043841 [Digitaria exilis]
MELLTVLLVAPCSSSGGDGGARYELLGIKMHANHFLVTDGLISSRRPNTLTSYLLSIKLGILADIDMVTMIPLNYAEFIDGLTLLVNNGTIPMSRIDDAIRRILRSPYADDSLAAGIKNTVESASTGVVYLERTSSSMARRLRRRRRGVRPAAGGGSILAGHVDALVAAWLPGTEGVADVLFGDYG